MLPIKIGLLDRTGKIPFEEISAVASAIDIQVTRDLGPAWGVAATVEPLPYHRGVPLGVWPAFIVANLPPGEGGFHYTANNQPYAKILNGPGWTVAASHEILEMCVDPSGNLTTTAPAVALSPQGVQTLTDTPQQYLVEICDPCEAEGYSINGIAVSDFILPAFYDANGGNIPRSFKDQIPETCFIIDGGYITWFDVTNNAVMQMVWVGTPKPQIYNLGPLTAGMSLRQFADNHRLTARDISTSGKHPAIAVAAHHATVRNSFATANAANYPE
jgi:hypothetical protein